MRMIATITAALLLAGCGANKAAESAPPASPSTVTVTPTPTGPPVAQRYATVEALKNAAVGAGYACPAWVQDNVIPSAAESGTCSDESVVNPDVFMTFASQADLDEILPVFKSKVGVSGANLIGPNWIINADDAAAVTRLAAALGGTVQP
jgi:hypothetical protein